ncbi:hypothetical protein MLD38_025790 [Melastoma candidum]|uniref:Uncharacterized protein n=1 Tax=Melastoma candidum TaxID=119954 RepID=A0ACB9NXV5_9MYRT|nr:hypothetical protein MLD38_025790 [Melastoma candidum]
MTPFSIPPEIFDQLRRDLRAQSGIPSFDQTDPAIPTLQPCESCISQVDPSPPYSRCRHCKGRLLRGVNSTFCVFCGEEGFGEVTPDPLNFRDSKGYAWLIEALALDGSENVVPISGEDESYREKDRVKDEIPLSDLLSLEIKWSLPAEKPSDSGRVDSAQTKISLNLGGAELDSFFGEGTNVFSSSTPEKKSGDDEGSRIPESNITRAPGNLRLSGNVPLPSTSVNSTGYESRNSMSAWDAEFQSADFETAQKVSPSPDPFSGSSVDLSAHVDEMFGSGNEQKRHGAKPSSNTDKWFDDDPRSNANIGFNGQDLGPKASHDTGPKPSSSDMDNWFDDYPRGNSNIVFNRQDLEPKPSFSNMDNWFDDDPRGNSSVGFHGQDLGPKPSLDGQGGITEGTSKSATDFTWTKDNKDNKWLSSATCAIKNDGSDEDDSWNDFTSSTNAVGNYTWKHAGDVTTSNPTPPTDLFSSSNDLMMDFGFSTPDIFSGASSITMQPVNSTSVQTEAFSSDRVLSMDTTEAGEETVKPEGCPNATSGESDQLKMLISQMHDLSFMLDSNLSIPQMSGKPSPWER